MVDPKVKRLLLRPLTKKKKRITGAKSQPEALALLDERALGEMAVRNLRDAFAPRRLDRKEDNWKDEKRVREFIDLTKALYASRRISFDQYVFYAASHVEGIHDSRWIDGTYDRELAPIDSALDAIRKEHALEPDQYWLRGEAPGDYAKLESEYESITDQKFIHALEEFGLSDLATLRRERRKEFDRLRERGRRTVHHSNELAHVVRDIVVRYENEARQAASAKAYSAAIICLGAGIEGLLLLRCLRSRKKAELISRSLPKRFKPRHPSDASTWTFENLIEVCLAAGWLPPVETSVAQYNVAGLAHILRLMRNYVHPGKLSRERPWSEASERDYLDANAIYVVLFSVLGKISSNKDPK